jgi:hypothetical protein
LQALQQACQTGGLLAFCCSEGFVVAQLVEALRYKPEGQGLDFFRPHYGPGVDSACNRNEYQECFLDGKGSR